MMNNHKLVKKMRFLIFIMGKIKIPMLGFTRPKLLSISEEEVSVKIKLRRRTKNHLNSMYFGALAVGADLAAGLHAFFYAEKEGVKISFAFKGLKADFLKRAESDVVFICKDGLKIKEAVTESIASSTRINKEIKVEAINSDEEVVAVFLMISSIKIK